MVILATLHSHSQFKFARIECPVGIVVREKAAPPKTFVQEVPAKEPGVRVFVVHSEEPAAYEGRQRTKAMDRVRVRLERLEQRRQRAPQGP